MITVAVLLLLTAAAQNGLVQTQPMGLADQIFVMRSDGSDVRLVANTEGCATTPRWSPDGSKIYFTNCKHVDFGRSCEVMAAPLEGRPRWITTPRILDERPALAPTKDLWQAVWQGGYPAIRHRRIAAHRWLNAYISTYVERDVRQRLAIGDSRAFQGFLELAAGAATGGHPLPAGSRGFEASARSTAERDRPLPARCRRSELAPAHHAAVRRASLLANGIKADTPTKWRRRSDTAAFSHREPRARLSPPRSLIERIYLVGVSAGRPRHRIPTPTSWDSGQPLRWHSASQLMIRLAAKCRLNDQGRYPERRSAPGFGAVGAASERSSTMRSARNLLVCSLAVISTLGLTGCRQVFYCSEWFSWDWCTPPTKSAAALPGDALYVTATAHATGALGTNWRSDVEVHNLADEAASARIWLLEHGAVNSSPASRQLDLAPNQSVRLGDVLANQFAANGQAALVLTPSSGRIMVTSRTYNLLGDGNDLGLPAGSTFGQYIPAQPLGDAIRFGDQGRLIQLSHSTADDSGFRTNLGLVNATDGELTVEVELRSADGALLGTVPVVLPPQGYRQLNRVFGRVTAGDVEDGYAVVRTSTAGGRFFAYASVVDNLTGDPVAIIASRLPGAAPATPSEPVYVVASAHVAGAAGTNWRTDVEVHCWSEEQAVYTVELLAQGANNSSPTSRAFVLASGASVRFEDILDTVFGVHGSAALRIVPTSGRIVVTSRTFNLLAAGNDAGLPAGATFGQYIPGSAADEAIGFGEEGRLIQLSHSTDASGGFRTNLVLVNASNGTIDVEIDLYDAGGTLLGTLTRTLLPYEYQQLNRVYEMVTGASVADGLAVVRTATEGGAFFALASVVDNLIGDPVGMSAPLILSPESEAILGRAEDLVDIVGQGGLDNLVGYIQTIGAGGLIDQLVADQPDVATRTSTGMVIDYGTGYTAPDGSIRSGSITVDISGLVADSGGITGTMTISHDDLLVDGQAPVTGPTACAIDLVERADGTVAGEIAFSPIGSATSAGALSGTVGIDTGICLEYPISGSVTATVEGEAITLAFSPDCDGDIGHEVSPAPPDRTFSYSYGNPSTAHAQQHIVSTDNAELGSEGGCTGCYWRSVNCGETFEGTDPGVITFHFPFDGPVRSGRLFHQVATFHWSYSRGHVRQLGSTNGVDWQLLTEVEPPDLGQGRGGGWNGELPQMFIGATDIWLRTELYAYGPGTANGGIYCNTAQMSRWDPAQTTNTFELEVELE